jgi:hypothetical protein
MPQAPSECARCGELFIRKHPLQKYCGVQCRNLAFIERRRRLNASGRHEWGVSCCCEYFPCGAGFRAKRRDAHYCSNACRQAHWRDVHNPKKTAGDDAQRIARASEGTLNPGQVRILRALRAAGRRELDRKELKQAAGIGVGSKNLWALFHHEPPLILINEYEPDPGERAHHVHLITAEGRKVLERAEGLSPPRRAPGSADG